MLVPRHSMHRIRCLALGGVHQLDHHERSQAFSMSTNFARASWLLDDGAEVIPLGAER